MAERFTSYNLVIFYGPPNCGKTFFYEQHLSKSHVHVAPSAEFAANPGLTIRQLVISKIVVQLKQGRNVVIDDENSNFTKRDSYVSLVRKKSPSSTILCLKFRPRDGALQLRWAREFLLAATAVDNIIDGKCARVPLKMSESDGLIEQWTGSTESQDSPRESEGYSLIKEITLSLKFSRMFKLEVPCLFIQYEALFYGKNQETSLVAKAAAAITRWYENNLCGRVTVISDGQAITTGSVKEKDQKMRSLLKDLVKEISECPVYLLHITDVQLSGFLTSTPQPGMIAFLQYVHCAHLTHKATMYWYNTPSHMKMAHNAGVKHIKASRVFQHINLAATSHGTTAAPEPDLLKALEVIPRSRAGSIDESPAEVPLYEQTRQSPDGVGSISIACGRQFYMAVKASSDLERYQELYAVHATPAYQEDSKIGLLSRQTSQPPTIPPPATSTKPGRGLPKWMLSKSERDKDRSLRNIRNRKESKTAHQSQVPRTVYMMNTSELVDTAKLVLREAREAEPTDEEIACHLSTEKQDNLMGIFSNIDSNQPNPRSDTSQRHQEATGRLTPVRHTTKEITPENVDNSIATDQFLEHFLGNGDSAISKVARSPGFPCQTTIAASPSSDILEDLLDLTAVDKQSTTLDISGASCPDAKVKITRTPEYTQPGTLITRSKVLENLVPETATQFRKDSTTSENSRSTVADSFVGNTASGPLGKRPMLTRGETITLVPDVSRLRGGIQSASPVGASKDSLRGQTKSGLVIPHILVSDTVTTLPETGLAEVHTRAGTIDPPRKRTRVIDTSLLDDLI